ncbi:MAG: branched-chain amino acid ABC transporter substrate-binding protein [Acidimicrobiia bacterium]
MLRRRAFTAFVSAVIACGALSAMGVGGVAGAHGEKVVKIGVLVPLDAGLVEFGTGIRNSVQLAVDQANKNKVIPGWEIELVAVDDSSDPAVGVANAPQLVDDAHVIGVVGTYNSGVAEAVLPLLAPANVTLLSPSNTLSSLTLGADPANPARPFHNYFRMVASDSEQAPFLAASVDKLGFENVAVVSETKAVSQGLADAFVAAFTGIVTVQQTVPDGATDFSDFLEAALVEPPDAIFFGGEYQVAATLRAQATEAGFEGPIVGGDGMKDQAYIDAAGDASEGDFASSVGVPAAKLKTAKKFFKDYKKAGFDEPSTDYGPYAYDAANLLVLAARDALKGEDEIPDDARVLVTSAVRDAKGKGVTGKLRFDEFGDTTNVVFTIYRVDGTPLEFTPIKP